MTHKECSGLYMWPCLLLHCTGSVCSGVLQVYMHPVSSPFDNFDCLFGGVVLFNCCVLCQIVYCSTVTYYNTWQSIMHHDIYDWHLFN